MKRLTSLLAGLMLTFPVLAQDVATTAEDETEEIKRYTVEVIIFSYAEDVGTGTEIFVPDVVEPDDNYAAYSNLGSTYYMSRQYEEAARMYTSALGLDSSDYRVWMNLASAFYWSSGQRERAMAAYRRAAAMAEEIGSRPVYVMVGLPEMSMLPSSASPNVCATEAKDPPP